MKKTREFQPALISLEERTVPSAGPSSPNAQDVAEVRQAFQTFEQTYRSGARSMLLVANPSATARADFDAAIDRALMDLNAEIGKAISNLPSAATLATTIQGELLGSDASALQVRLKALPTPTRPNDISAQAFQRGSRLNIDLTENLVARQVKTAIPTASGVDRATLLKSISQVNQAFGTFGNGYRGAVRTVLLAANTDPLTNRTAFDARITSLLTDLNTQVGQAVASFPNASGLQATLTTKLLSGASNANPQSLQSRLLGLTTPTRGVVSRLVFGFRSSVLTAQANGQVVAAIRAAANTPVVATV